MALSDRYHLNVGDEVQDKQTGERGRVLNVVKIAGDAFLVTVAILVLGKVQKKIETVVRRGQVAGLRFEKIFAARLGQSQPGPQVRSPHQGHTVSQNLVARTEQGLKALPPPPTIGSIDGTQFGARKALDEAQSSAQKWREWIKKRRYLGEASATFAQEHAGTGLAQSYNRASDFNLSRASYYEVMLAPLENALRNPAFHADYLSDFIPNRLLYQTLGGVEDPELQAKLSDRLLQDLKGKKVKALARKRQVDDTLSYLTGSGHRVGFGADGKPLFQGSYLSDVVFGKGGPLKASDLYRAQELEKLLRGVTLDPETRRRFDSLVSEDTRNLFDVLERSRRSLASVPGSERATAFRSHAELITQVAREKSTRYQRASRYLNLIQGRLDEVHGIYQIARQEAGVESRQGTGLGVYDISVGNPNYHFQENRLGTHPYEEFHGQQPGVLDVQDLIWEGEQVEAGAWAKRTGVTGGGRPTRFHVNRNTLFAHETPHEYRKFVEHVGRKWRIEGVNLKEGTVTLVGPSVPPQTPAIWSTTLKELGDSRDTLGNVSPYSLTLPIQKLDEKAQATVYDAAKKLTRTVRERVKPGDFVGRIVPIQGLPHRIAGVDAQRRSLTVLPLHQPLTVRTDLPLHQSSYLEQLAHQVTQSAKAAHPATDVDQIFRSAVEGTGEVAGIAIRATRGREAQLVPVATLYSYLLGDVSAPGHRQHRQAFGARTARQFEESALQFGFMRQLKARALGLQQRLQDLKLTEEGEDARELYSMAREFIHDELTQADRTTRYAGRSLDEIQTRLLSRFERVFPEWLREQQHLATPDSNLGPEDAESFVSSRAGGGDAPPGSNQRLYERSSRQHRRELVERWRARDRFDPESSTVAQMQDRAAEQVYLYGQLQDLDTEPTAAQRRAIIREYRREEWLKERAQLRKIFFGGREDEPFLADLTRGAVGAVEITEANEGRLVYLFNSVLGMAEKGNLKDIESRFRERLRKIGGRYALSLVEDGSLLYQSFVHPEGAAGVVFSPTAKHQQRFLGAANTLLTLNEKDQVRLGMDSRWWERAGRFENEVKRGLQKQALEASLIRDTGPAQLAVYQSGAGKLVGYHSSLVPFDSVAENTRKIFNGEAKSYLSLDIETFFNEKGLRHERHGEVYEAALHRYVRNEQGIYELKETLYNAVLNPKLALEADREKLGKAVKGGATQVGSEGELLQGLTAHLKATEELVLGHNVAAFDVPHLLERSGDSVYQQIAQSRTADTLLAAHAGTNLPMVDLERLSQHFYGLFNGAGGVKKETHVAAEDALLAGGLPNVMQAHREQLNRNLAGAQNISVNVGDLYYHETTGRGYRLAGVVDPQKSQAALADYYQSLGKEPGDAREMFGLAFQEIDFHTGQPVEHLTLDFFGTPRGLAGALENRYRQMGSMAELGELANAKTEDLARRRVRRMLTGENTFQNYLKEQERFWAVQGYQGDLNPLLQDLSHRAMTARSSVDQDILASTATWVAGQLEDPRIREQLRKEVSFFGAESDLHAPVVDWLKQHVEHQGGTRSAWDEAHLIWSQYQEELTQKNPWQTLENVAIHERQRQISVEVPVLASPGKGPVRVGIKVASPELVLEDVNRQTLRILDKLRDEDLHRIFGPQLGRSAREGTELRNAGDVFFTSTEGQQIRQRIWQDYLGKALKEDSRVQVAGEMAGRFQISEEAARNLDVALQEIHEKGSAQAAQFVPSLTNPLADRKLDGAQVAAVQQRLMQGSPLDALDRLDTSFNPIIQPRHGGPTDWVGRSTASILQEAGKLPEGDQRSEFTGTLRRVLSRMTSHEQAHTQRLLDRLQDHWLTGENLGAQFQKAAGNLTDREFRLHNLGLQAADFLEENPGLAHGAGIALLALGGATALFAGFKAPKKAPAPPAEDGMSSTDREVQHRQAVQEELQGHRVHVTIHGHGGFGMDPQELVSSIHASLGSFFGRQIEHSTHINDHRATIDQGYLDRVAGKLMR